MKQKPYTKDFILVVIGQIISLFGNAAIRFALPLYLLNQTGSSALYGSVTACAFLPMILFSPLGGIIADRVNKRNIMVFLDFFTAAVILAFTLLRTGTDLVLLLTATLMLLYGIAGAYQPAVQASMPALVESGQLMAANSVINMISSLASLLGPILGGILYSSYGLTPILWVCTACFLFSATMEVFIHIPFSGQPASGSIWQILKTDLTDSFRFIRHDKPSIWKAILTVCGINLFLSAMIVVSLPWLITEILTFSPARANELYGFAQGAMAAGGLAGGVCAGAFSQRLSIRSTGSLLITGTLCVFPIAAVFFFPSSDLIRYLVLTLCCFLLMIFSTVFTIQIMSFIQAQTPPHLVGKVISVILTISMCAQPLGNALYGVLFELLRGHEAAVILFAGIVSLLIACGARRLFHTLAEE